jgi:hypothetical protein
MYQLTSLIQNKLEVYLSRGVALISKSGSRVSHDTLKIFLKSLGFVESLMHCLARVIVARDLFCFPF